MARALVMEVAHRLGMLKPLPLRGREPKAPLAQPLDLQPGELVRVRSAAEIEATLDDRGLNRGLSFAREMLPYCGQTLRVKDRVDRLIDENDGCMLRIPRDCIILDRPCVLGGVQPWPLGLRPRARSIRSGARHGCAASRRNGAQRRTGEVGSPVDRGHDRLRP